MPSKPSRDSANLYEKQGHWGEAGSLGATEATVLRLNGFISQVREIVEWILSSKLLEILLQADRKFFHKEDSVQTDIGKDRYTLILTMQKKHSHMHKSEHYQHNSCEGHVNL